MLRTLAYAGACAVALLLTPSYACADTIAVRSGNGFLYWDGSLTSITLVADGSKFSIEPYAGSDSGFSGGATVDLSTTIPVTNGGNHLLPQTYHGQDYRAWVSGSLQIAGPDRRVTSRRAQLMKSSFLFLLKANHSPEKRSSKSRVTAANTSPQKR